MVYKTLKTKPEDETQWSVRSMGAETGLSKDAVHRIWRTFGLQPHRQNHFKLSTDPFFVDKVRDMVGLYMNPPEHAVVLCVDEKSQIQALDLLPLGLGYVEGVTHDYKRHGTTTLFAALDTATGEVMTQCKPRHSSSFCAISRTTCPVTSTFISSSTTTARTSMTRSKKMAGTATSISHSLHAHLCFMAQSGGDLVQHHYPSGDPARLVSQS